jgi:hypothetical protein
MIATLFSTISTIYESMSLFSSEGNGNVDPPNSSDTDGDGHRGRDGERVFFQQDPPSPSSVARAQLLEAQLKSLEGEAIAALTKSIRKHSREGAYTSLLSMLTTDTMWGIRFKKNLGTIKQWVSERYQKQQQIQH